MWNGKGTVSGKWKRRGRRRERPTPDNITCPPSPSLIAQYLPPNNEAQKKVCVSVEPHHQNSKRIKPHTSSHSPTIPIYYSTFWTGNYFSLFSLLTYYYSHTPHVMSHDMDTCIYTTPMTQTNDCITITTTTTLCVWLQTQFSLLLSMTLYHPSLLLLLLHF